MSPPAPASPNQSTRATGRPSSPITAVVADPAVEALLARLDTGDQHPPRQPDTASEEEYRPSTPPPLDITPQQEELMAELNSQAAARIMDEMRERQQDSRPFWELETPARAPVRASDEVEQPARTSVRRRNDTKEDRPFWERTPRHITDRQQENRFIGQPAAACPSPQRGITNSAVPQYNNIASPWPASKAWRRSSIDEERRRRPVERRPIPLPLGGLSKNQMLGSIKNSWGEEPEGTGMFTILPDPPSRSTSPFQVKVRNDDEQRSSAAARGRSRGDEREPVQGSVEREERVERKAAAPWKRTILSDEEKPPMSPGEAFFGPRHKK